MLRPATPLSILLFISFVLLLISTISTPIVKGIPLARYRDVNFGVFGYCQDGGGCSGTKIGYTTDGLWGSDTGDFNLPSSTRSSLSALLIVHPVAALCNLVVLGLAIAAHFHSPSHSARYLLGLLILLLPTLLVTLLAFLVDILIFVPHLQWGGWIVLASTILITASGVVTCAMRRTLVSRKARKRRIAENAEMSGENFYTRQDQESKMATVPTMSTESKVPLVNGSPGADNLPAFTPYSNGRSSYDRQHVGQPAHSGAITPVSPINDEHNRYYTNSSRSNSRPRPADDGIPLNPINTQVSEAPFRPSPTGRSPGPLPPNSYGMRGGHGPPRGRGGHPARGGYGPQPGYGPRGPPPQNYGRGGFSPNMRGGYGGRGRGGYSGSPMAAGAIGGAATAAAHGNRGPPPPGYIPQNGETSPTQYGPHQGYPSAVPRGTSPYSRNKGASYEPVSPSQYTAADDNTTTYVAYSKQAQSPVKAPSVHSVHSMHSRGKSPAGVYRSPSPPPDMPPIGQAISTNAAYGRPTGYETDVHDMVGLQRDQEPVGSPSREQPQEYIPPRSQWNNPVQNDIAPAHHAATMTQASSSRPRGNSNASGSYYEDVDPRFAESADVISALPQRTINYQQHQPTLPNTYEGQDARVEPSHAHIPHTASYEDLPVGARSPAESETSHFTSVSQRGVNPNWRPGNGGEFNSFGPRRPPQARQDVLLANNPDFELVPPPARFGGRGGRSGFRGGSLGGGPSGRMPPPSAMGVSGDSPYGPATMREI